MSLEIGIDSYVTLAEAEDYISKHFASDDKLLLNWNERTDNDKEAKLRESCESINNLKFRGKRKGIGQELEFPRVLGSMCGIGFRLYVSQFEDNGLISNDITGDGGIKLAKKAQIVNALYGVTLGSQALTSATNRFMMLTSKKAGPISETYGGRTHNSDNAMVGIYTDKVYSILQPWLSSSRVTV